MRPRLLDLFCGASGAGAGYARAGFDVLSVDLAPMARYPLSKRELSQAVPPAYTEFLGGHLLAALEQERAA